MSGSWSDQSSTAADAAAIEALIPTAWQSTAQAQVATGAFIREYGGQVVAGHSQVTGPAGDAGGDADLSGPDASDTL